MVHEGDLAKIKREVEHPVKIRMRQGESSGQPIYSDIVSVKGEQQGIFILDFGFLDPKIMISLNHAAKSGGKIPEYINAKMSCRIAINYDAANQLAIQLEQVLNKKTEKQSHQGSLNSIDQASEAENSTSGELGNKAEETKQGGFRFPWSKKK